MLMKKSLIKKKNTVVTNILFCRCNNGMDRPATDNDKSRAVVHCQLQAGSGLKFLYMGGIQLLFYNNRDNVRLRGIFSLITKVYFT